MDITEKLNDQLDVCRDRIMARERALKKQKTEAV